LSFLFFISSVFFSLLSLSLSLSLFLALSFVILWDLNSVLAKLVLYHLSHASNPSNCFFYQWSVGKVICSEGSGDSTVILDERRCFC
jgi:hypothetical protein